MNPVEPHPQGAVLRVRARGGASSSGIRGIQQGMLKVWTTAAPEKGKANRALIKILADGLSLRAAQLELIGGATSNQKRFLVRQITPAELSRRVRETGAQ